MPMEAIGELVLKLPSGQEAEVIDGWRVAGPIAIIAHSLSCLVSRYYVERLGGRKKLHLALEPSDDSTVPERSAVLEGSEIHPVEQYQEALHADNDVKMRLKPELTRWA